MPAAYKTPGVYIVEKDAFPNSVVEVATAVPAFIGYTEKAEFKGTSLLNKPTRLSSLSEFHTYFGGAPKPKFKISEQTDPEKVDFTVTLATGEIKKYSLEQIDGQYLMYSAMRLFFANGGGACFVVSVGKTGYPAQGGPDPSAIFDSNAITAGIDALRRFEEPTLLVAPDAVLMKDQIFTVQSAMLQQCGQMMNRFAILDLLDGDKAISPEIDPIQNFRNGSLPTAYLSYGAAYYPWLNTNLIQERDLDVSCVDDIDGLTAILTEEMQRTPPEGQSDDPRVAAWNAGVTDLMTRVKSAHDSASGDAAAADARSQTNQALMQMSPGFKALLAAAAKKLNLLPPSGAMAGVYKSVDDTRGVWKAPANVSVLGTVSPAVEISNQDQEDLNVTPAGKSINAIRSFVNEGTLVWGARTLDGNSLDWRYINVRRTLIMLEESCKLAAKAYVFEPNVAGTWMSIKTMIENFLTSVWKRGGLAGTTPTDAFSVHVGLGDTMTAEDILEGYLRVTVLVAVSHPAEFIEITFQQQMQKS